MLVQRNQLRQGRLPMLAILLALVAVFFGVYWATLNADTLEQMPADLSTSTKTVDKSEAAINDTLTYEITLRNSGDSAATVMVSDTLPANVAYVAGSATIVDDNGALIVAPPAFAAGTLTFEAALGDPDFEPDAVFMTVSFQAIVTGTGIMLGDTIVNTADYSYDDGVGSLSSAATTVVEDTGSVNFMPMLGSRFPAIPFAPELDFIKNEDQDSEFDLEWTEPELHGNSYEIWRDTMGDFSGSPELVDTTSDTNYAFTEDHPYGVWFYRVRSVNNAGVGEWSNTRAVTVSPLTVTDNNASLIHGQCTNLEWDFPTASAVFVSWGFGYDEVGTAGVSSRLVCPSRTTTFSASATEGGVTTQYEITVEVVGGDNACISGERELDPVIIEHTSTDFTVGSGENFTISWSVECANTVETRTGAEGLWNGTVGSGTAELTIGETTEFGLRVSFRGREEVEYALSTFVVEFED